MAKKIEDILGIGTFSGKRTIPGTVAVEGREYWYVEDDGSGDFDASFLKVVLAVDPPLHARGGALTGGCELTLPDGRKFHALSYKGDLDGWRAQIAQGARKLGLDAARAIDGELVLANGLTIPISECEVRFY